MIEGMRISGQTALSQHAHWLMPRSPAELVHLRVIGRWSCDGGGLVPNRVYILSRVYTPDIVPRSPCPLDSMLRARNGYEHTPRLSSYSSVNVCWPKSATKLFVCVSNVTPPHVLHTSKQCHLARLARASNRLYGCVFFSCLLALVYALAAPITSGGKEHRVDVPHHVAYS